MQSLRDPLFRPEPTAIDARDTDRRLFFPTLLMILAVIAAVLAVVIGVGTALRQMIPAPAPATKARPAPSPVVWIETQEARR